MINVLRTGLNKANDACIWLWVTMLSCSMLLFDAVEAEAGSTLGSRMDELKKGLSSVKDVILVVAIMIGIVLCITGIVKMTKSNREEGGLMKAILFIAAGALLIAVPSLLITMADTFLGDNARNTNLNW